MDLTTFSEMIESLSIEDIRRCAAGLTSQELSVADEIVQWRTDLAFDRLLRSERTRAEAQRAAAAGQRMARLVVELARRNGTDLPDSDVTQVARTSGQIARALSLNEKAEASVALLLHRWKVAMNCAAPSALTAA